MDDFSDMLRCISDEVSIQKSSRGLLSLPNELLEIVFCDLNVKDTFATKMVCRRLFHYQRSFSGLRNEVSLTENGRWELALQLRRRPAEPFMLCSKCKKAHPRGEFSDKALNSNDDTSRICLRFENKIIVGLGNDMSFSRLQSYTREALEDASNEAIPSAYAKVIIDNLSNCVLTDVQQYLREYLCILWSATGHNYWSLLTRLIVTPYGPSCGDKRRRGPDSFEATGGEFSSAWISMIKNFDISLCPHLKLTSKVILAELEDQIEWYQRDPSREPVLQSCNQCQMGFKVDVQHYDDQPCKVYVWTRRHIGKLEDPLDPQWLKNVFPKS